jgi:hypothetical protein
LDPAQVNGHMAPLRGTGGQSSTEHNHSMILPVQRITEQVVHERGECNIDGVQHSAVDKGLNPCELVVDYG